MESDLFCCRCVPCTILIVSPPYWSWRKPRSWNTQVAPKRTNAYRFVYKYRPSTSTQFRLGRDSTNQVIGHTLPYCSPILTDKHTKSCAWRTSLKKPERCHIAEKRDGIKRRWRCLLGDLWKILMNLKSICVESGYQGCYVGLSSCPKAVPSVICEEAGEEITVHFWWTIPIARYVPVLAYHQSDIHNI